MRGRAADAQDLVARPVTVIGWPETSGDTEGRDDHLAVVRAGRQPQPGDVQARLLEAGQDRIRVSGHGNDGRAVQIESTGRTVTHASGGSSALRLVWARFPRMHEL